MKNFINLHNNISLIEYDYYNFAKINNDVVKNHVTNEYEFLLFCNNDIMLLNNINHFETPPQSPDLMPIEMVCLIKDNFIKYAVLFQILHSISGME